MSTLSDEKLLGLACGGDQNAFAELVARYRPRIYSVAYRMTMDVEDSLDITQETAMTLCRKVGQLRDSASLWPWLRRATVNHCLTMFRQRKKEREKMNTFGRERVVNADPGDSVVDTMQKRQEVTRVERAMRNLSRQQRAAFSLRFFEECSLAEIAEAMGISAGAVKSHLFRATQRLREILAPELGI